MSENFDVTTPRQRRALIELLNKESIEVKQLGVLIGALNPGQVIFELRGQGFHQVIKTIFFERYDRDGKRCRVGRYLIPPEDKKLVSDFLTRDGLTTVSKKALFKATSYNPHGKEIV